jgi:hypothetical protein
MPTAQAHLLGSPKLGGVERLKCINISDGLCLLIPFEIAQRYVFRSEVRYEEAVLFDRRDGFVHIEVLWWLWAYATKF